MPHSFWVQVLDPPAPFLVATRPQRTLPAFVGDTLLPDCAFLPMPQTLRPTRPPPLRLPCTQWQHLAGPWLCSSLATFLQPTPRPGLPHTITHSLAHPSWTVVGQRPTLRYRHCPTHTLPPYPTRPHPTTRRACLY